MYFIFEGMVPFKKNTLLKLTAVKFTFCLVFFFQSIYSQVPPMKTEVYISEFSEYAIRQMVQYKIPASVTLAQAIFESNNGNSHLAKKSNNHFGIKCHYEWGGDTIIKSDDTLNECFRKYETIEDSYTDHSLFLKSRARYSHLFNLNLNDYKSWCYGLKNAGYATYSGYAEALIIIIETYNLYEFDRIENIKKCTYKNFNNATVKPSPITLSYNRLQNCNFDLLFSNEKDVLIQSINMLIDQFEEDESEKDIAADSVNY